MGKLVDRRECQVLLDTGASKSFMSKSHYLCCKSLRALPNLHQELKEFKWEMDSLSVYCL